MITVNDDISIHITIKIYVLSLTIVTPRIYGWHRFYVLKTRFITHAKY